MSNLISEKQIFTDNLPEFVAALTNASASGVSLIENSSGVLRTLVQGANISITDNGNGTVTITSSSGYAIVVVANYSALPAANTVPSQFYWCSASQGTAWLPGSLGGTYYNSGLYYSNGVSWEFMNTAYQATQAEVDIGTVTDQFVSPATFTGASKWNNYVPYTGATSNVNLGLYDITALHLIKNGGVSSQFLKADGSVDNNVYLTSADLPSTLDLYATTYPSDIPGYFVLVRNISDIRFDTIAVDVSTGIITTTNQLVGELITDANIISGNPGIFNITTIGNISRTAGTGQAEFFFRVYQRDSLGVETFIAQSDNTLPVTNGGYVEFSATALWNNGIFLNTDRVVIKYYANRLAAPVGSNPTYNFQFGGLNPVRSTAAVPVAVLPNIYLSDLADVENIPPLNNEILYWNNMSSLWEHSLVINLLSPASSIVDGYLLATDWSTFNGKQNALGYTPVPETRNLTINGTTYDLSADRTWTISAGSSLTIKDEGSTLTTAATSIDFTGAGVTASAVGNDVTVNITGGGGGTSATSNLFAYYNFI